MDRDSITIIVPVYGRAALLEQALDSVVKQEDEGWRLLIADDGSDSETKTLIERWMKDQQDKRIRYDSRDRNIGLFSNLNRALGNIETEWVILLCSDDLLLKTAVGRIKTIHRRFKDASLVLSTFESIDGDGAVRFNDSGWHHDKICKSTSYFERGQLIPYLLKLGSINGNLTGMAFSVERWREAGRFKDDWKHAADWEWLIRAVDAGPTVLNRSIIARVRTHAGQLSNENRVNRSEIKEVSEVIRMLLQHKCIKNIKGRKRWAGEIMQHQLWNTLKGLKRVGWSGLFEAMIYLKASAGIGWTLWCLMMVLPERVRKKIGFLLLSKDRMNA